MTDNLLTKLYLMIKISVKYIIILQPEDLNISKYIPIFKLINYTDYIGCTQCTTTVIFRLPVFVKLKLENGKTR